MDSPAPGSAEESLSALSTQLIAHGYLTRPLDLSTLFLPPPLPTPSSTTGEVSSKSLKKHQDLLILQARAREQLAKCMWGMLDKRTEEREVMEGLLAREARASMEGERERAMRERAEREREGMGRELEMERARARDAEAKLKTEQERHRHAKDELSKMKSALQFVKTQALHDQKRREAEVTALHQRLQKATTSTDSSFTRFVVLNPHAGANASSSPLSATFGGRTSRLSSGSSARSPTPSSSSGAAALEAEVELLSSALSECSTARTHLEGENRQLREFVGEVGEWAEGVVEMEEFAVAKGEEGAEELEGVLGASVEGDESFMIPTPHLALPIPALTGSLHRKLYAIRLALSTLSASTSARLEAQRAELAAEVEDLEAQLEEQRFAAQGAKEEVEEMERKAEEAERLVREFVESKAEGRRKTMARDAESDDDSVPAELAAQLAAQKAARLAAKEAKKQRAAPAPISAPAPPVPSSSTAAPRPSEPPSASVAAFLSELGLDTPAVASEPLTSAAAAKARQARFEQVTGSVEKAREKKAVQLEGVGGRERERPSIARAPSAGSSKRLEGGEAPRRTSGSRVPFSSSFLPKPASSSSVALSPPTTSSSTLSSILSLSDSPPVASDTLVSTAAAATEKKKVLKPSSAGNGAAVPAVSQAKDKEAEKTDDLEKVRAKKAALLARARAARA
ncbi:hypothetical protein JCM6882_007551 [Rhodosporidiobolus microsporus]